MLNARDNVVTTKIKALFGKRLSLRDYETLLNKKHLSDIVLYLKSESYFKNCLSGINEKTIRRGQLENLIRNDLLHRLSTVLKYSLDVNDYSFKLVTLASELDIIFDVVRSFYSGDRYSVISSLPIMIESHLPFDLKKITAVDNMNSLCNEAKRSVYYKELCKYRNVAIDELNLTSFSHELYNHYYEIVLAELEKNFKSKKKEDLKSIFHIQMELHALSHLYRLKKYFKVSANILKETINPTFHFLRKKDFTEIINRDNPEFVIEKLKESAYAHYFDFNSYKDDPIEVVIDTILYNYNKSKIFFTSDKDIALVVYNLLSKTEVQNIIDIIEGVRYGLSPDKIRKLLII